MAKGGKQLMKLRSALKKINSLGKLRHQSTTDDDCHVSVSGGGDGGLHTVYVGKSLRPYKVSSEVLDHPVIKELVGRSDGCGSDIEEETTVIGCEVVLFEHLLWMLHNTDPLSEPLHDLVAFYAY